MTVNDYDAKEGIAACSSTLHDLNELAKARREAAESGSRLSKWVVRGQWLLDEYGNWSRISVPDVRPLYGVPAAASLDEFFDFAAGFGLEDTITSSSFALPRAGATCLTCGRAFSAATCWDVSVHEGREDVDGSPFVGHTLAEAESEHSSRRTDARWRVTLQAPVKNAKRADAANPAGYVHHPCSKADMAYVIQPGDVIAFDVLRHEHGPCRAERIRAQAMDSYRGIIEDSGLPHGDVVEVPNGYWNDSRRHGPWARTRSFFGDVTVGYRKKVIEILWDGDADGLNLFKDEGVTHGRNFVHAWGRDKAVEYLRKVHEAARELREAGAAK